MDCVRAAELLCEFHLMALGLSMIAVVVALCGLLGWLIWLWR